MKRVAVIMPTRGRPEWARQTVDCFLSQTYSHKDMIVIDDADQPSFPDGLDHRAIYYTKLAVRDNIPMKLNMACEIARQAEIITRFDSDDWYCQTRIEEQVHRLETTGKAVTGYNSFTLFEPETGRKFEYVREAAYACGSSLTFLRSFWETCRFKETKFTGSDNHFVYAAIEAGKLDFEDGRSKLVARIHSGNTSPKDERRRGSNYAEVFTSLPAEFLNLQEACR